MSDALTENDLIETLKLIELFGPAGAAEKLGISSGVLRQRRTTAKLRGLSSATRVTDELAKARTKLILANAELKSIKRDNVTAAEVRETIYGLSALTPDPPEWIVDAGHIGPTGVPITFWSDWHWGEKIGREEVGGVNEFDRKIAKARARKLVETVTELAKCHMVNPDYPGIVVCLGGDMVGGNIHEELRETNDGPVQQSLLEVQEILIWALTTMADEFGKVFVPCVVGNHGRTTIKPRAKRRVYESYEWNLYCQLERWFKAKGDDRVQFSIPGETDAHFTVLGHRFLLTHGDTLGVRGGDGIIGAIGPIARGATKIGRSEAQIGRDFDTLLMGHYHTYIPRGDATPVLVNGSLKGYDEYARLMLRVPYSRPSQALFFVNEKYGITAQWAVYLEKKVKSSDSSEWIKWEKRNP